MDKVPFKYVINDSDLNTEIPNDTKKLEEDFYLNKIQQKRSFLQNEFEILNPPNF